MGDGPAEEIASKVQVGRRDFVKRMMVGSAFTVPLLSSFGLGGLPGCRPNQPNNQSFP